MYASRKDNPFVTLYGEKGYKSYKSPLSILTFPAIMFALEDMNISNGERLNMLVRAFNWVKCFGYPTCEDVYGMSKHETKILLDSRNRLMCQLEAAHMFGDFFSPSQG